MKKLLLILSATLFVITCYAQEDTAKCVIIVKNIKKCTTKHIKAYEITRYDEESKEWETVKYLNEKFKMIRARRNRCITFYESSM